MVGKEIMIEFKESNVKELSQDIYPLLKEHYEEIALNRDVIKLKPDWEGYKALENIGALHCIAVRDGNKLIGYSISIISNSLHYKDNIFAINDVLFISKEYRKARVGYRLIKFMKKCFEKRNVSIAHFHVKIDHDFSDLLEFVGCEQVEKVFQMRLI